MGAKIRAVAKKRWKILGAFTSLLAFGGCSWFLADRVVSSSLEELRPGLEEQLSKPLGHPLKIGPYRGLRLWGLAIGETEILESSLDGSTARFSGGRIEFAPLASFLHWRPVVDIKLNGAIFRLRRNEDGFYWVPGQIDGASSPPVDFRLSLSNPATVFLEPSNLKLVASGRGQVHFRIRRVGGGLRLHFPDDGSLFLQGQGSWDGADLVAKTRLKNVNLQSLQELLGPIHLASKGQLNGDFGLRLNRGRVRCDGGLSLSGLKIKTSNLSQSLSSPQTSFSCGKDRIYFHRSTWEYGKFVGNFGGDFLFNSPKNSFQGRSGFLRINYFGGEDQKFKVGLPLAFDREGVEVGEVKAVLALKSVPLAEFSELIGARVGGRLSVSGEVIGPLKALRPNLAIQVVNPEVSSIRLQEDWKGDLVESKRGGALLKMTPVGDVIPAELTANFLPDWRLDRMNFKRSDGSLSLTHDLEIGNYFWQAHRLKLDGVEFALPPDRRFERVFGRLSGDGIFNLQNQSVEGNVRFSYPRTMGLQLREAVLEGNIVNGVYSLEGDLFPPDIGEIALQASGRLGGGLHAQARARRVSARWLTLSALQLPKINLKSFPPTGGAEELGTLLTKSYGSSVDGQLKGLSAAKIFLKELEESTKRKFINPQDLRGELDADFDLKGADLSELNLSLEIRGYLWADGQNPVYLKNKGPFIATINGPLKGGEGNFSLVNIPFSLLSLVSPVPSGLNGGVGLSGKYRKKEDDIEFIGEFTLHNAKLFDNLLILELGEVSFSKSVLDLNVSLRSSFSEEPVNLKGQIPINALSPINLRVESHGDGLNFLDGLSNGSAVWKSGESHLKILISGNFNNPKANGYLVIENGEFIYNNQLITDLTTSMIFDFNRLEFQNFEAKLGPKGLISGKGAIALFNPSIERQPLELNMNQVRLALQIADVELSGNLILTRSLIKPTFGGELTIEKGFISPGKTKLVGTSSAKVDTINSSNSEDSDLSEEEPTYYSKFLEEQRWDFEEPLVLLGRDVEPTASKLLRSSIPNVSSVSFDNLRLRLGPDLRITSLPLANFGATGFLNLNGELGPSLQPRGVVRLLNGRVNLFTTTFNLDRKAANVAVFTPSLGLIPYVDVSLTSRVSESVSEGTSFQSSNVFSKNGTGPFGVGGFRLVRVMVKASGPADRIAENIELRSSPPMPRAQLLGLIGGNTLAGLTGGDESEMIASVLGRSLLSPVLGTISDSFSERLQLSLYPTYVTPEVKEETSDVQTSSQDEVTGAAPPQQAWVTEVGIDLTERFNFSVLATPNRSDIPPQGTLTYQVTPNFGVAGSLDNEGTWQSQLQLFFRF